MERVAARLGIRGGHRCYQAAWLGETPPAVPQGVPRLEWLGKAGLSVGEKALYWLF